jgi:hypothetical protein
MAGVRFTIRDDERFQVIVGWDDELESFVLQVWDGGEQVVSCGEKPHEVPTLSELLSRTGPYARVDVAVQSELRHAARPLSDQAQYPDPSELLSDDANVPQD